MKNLLKRLVHDEEGQGLIEYALILVGVAVVVIGVLIAIGTQVTDVFNDISAQFTGAGYDS